MSASIVIPPLATPSIVGFAEAEVFLPDVAADFARRIESEAAGSVPASVIGDIAPRMVAAVDAANSLHFRFELTEVDLESIEVVRGGLGTRSLPGLDADHATRKVTVAMPLRGSASITFPSIAKVRALRIGVVAMYAAFLANEVEPDDEFIAVVCHAVGPSFV